MKKIIAITLITVMFLILSACSGTSELSPPQGQLVAEIEEEGAREKQEDFDSSSVVEIDATSNEQREEENIMYLHIGVRTFTATLVENAATEALIELLEENPITIDMRDFGGIEKVGSLGTNLPTSNEQISTNYGDIMLFQGNQLVIFYDSHAWSYTRIGRINDVIQEDLIGVLGSGDVTITLSLSQ